MTTTFHMPRPRVLLLPLRAHAERAAPGAIGLGDLLGRSTMMPPVGKSGPGTKVDSWSVVRLRVGDQVERGVAKFGDVVRRNRGRHADRDALRAVGEQVRERGGQDDRLLLVALIILAEIDRVLVDALEQQARDLGHARFGVAIGGGVIAVDVAEIALPVDQRIARGEILREAHHRVIDRLVAVRDGTSPSRRRRSSRIS